MNLKNYLQDGADSQSRAVLMALQGRLGDGIESSWNDEFKRYEAEIQIARWENCREQGYIAYLKAKNNEQLNIIWFEHRNSDAIYAVKGNQWSLNALNIDSAEFINIYKNKYDVSKTFHCGEYQEMANWIFDEFQIFWNENKK